MKITKARLFLDYKGVKIYNTYKDGVPTFYNYSTREQRTLERHEEDFDVRELPAVIGMNAKTLYFSSSQVRPDHLVIIKAAIDQAVIKPSAN